MKIAVFSGGISEERAVSIESGKAVLNAFEEAEHDALSVVISKEGKFCVANNSMSPQAGIDYLLNIGVDVAFIALHGPFGEDGVIQGFLTTVGLPFTGPGLECAALSMNKYLTKLLFSHNAIKVPKGLLIPRNQKSDKLSLPLNLPVVVKPCNLGSSVGIQIVNRPEEFIEAIESVWIMNQDCLVEEFISGKEFSCPVVETIKGLKALPVIEIRPDSNHPFFDYKAKYDPDQAEEIIHKESSLLYDQLKEIALLCHKILGCKSFSRTDFIVADQQPYVLEINTIPGLSKNSLLPKSAKAAGISLSKLVMEAVELAKRPI